MTNATLHTLRHRPSSAATLKRMGGRLTFKELFLHSHFRFRPTMLWAQPLQKEVPPSHPAFLLRLF